MNYDRDSALIQPYYVIEEINRLTNGEAIIATGVVFFVVSAVFRQRGKSRLSIVS